MRYPRSNTDARGYVRARDAREAPERPICSFCHTRPAGLRVHVDGVDVWWCGLCIDKLRRES